MSSTSSINSLLSSGASSSSSSLDISSLLAASTGSSSVGIDVTSAVDAAIYAARAPERQWQSEQSTIQGQITALSSIQTALSAVSTDLTNLGNLQGSLASLTATSSDPSTLTAVAAAGTTQGSHVVVVNSLATSASAYSPSLASATASLGSSMLKITAAGGAQSSFTLGTNGSNNLTALVRAINSSALGITASVVNDAEGARLALVSNASGAGSNFTVTDSGTTGSSWTSASLASGSSPLPSGNFQVSDGTSSATITVAKGSSLSVVADQINSQGLGLSASVVSDSSGSHLAISSTTGGSVNVSSDPTLTFTQPSQGSNASLTVDGIPVSSASNTVTGAVKGLTLNLQGVTAGSPVTLTVAPDTAQITSAISQFVTDYNSASQLVNSQFAYSTSTSSQGALGSDSTTRSLQSMLLGIGAYQAPSDGSSPSVTTFANLGITMNDDGSLTLNTAQLNQTLQTNASSVQNFFQGKALNGFASTFQKQVDAYNLPSIGALSLDVKNLTQEYNSLQTNISDYESGYIASQTTMLTAMYSQAEIALQQLPAELKQVQAQLGDNSSGG